MSDQISRPSIRFTTPVQAMTFEQTLDNALAAEAAGFSGVTFSDRPHDPMLDGWTLSAAIAARTERVRLYHTTLNIPYRFPAVLAKEAATLDIVSNGRLDLCLGAGGEGNRPLYDSIGVPMASPGERLRGLRECIDILRGIWSNERFTYEGEVYSVEDAAGGVRPVQESIPIWIGALMPRALKLAGESADGFIKNQGWGTADELRQMNEAIDEAAIKAGRYPGAIRRVLNGSGYVASTSEEGARYREQGSAQNAFGTRGLIGTVDEILDLVREYRAAGVDTFNVRFPAGQQLEHLKRFGAEVIPAASGL
jgi:alkanesulfonate monooxygenase SsuD/methylene tetrahydromethanopterin reductase-like flavin-dependent oxidoreductase (luciferase family)